MYPKFFSTILDSKGGPAEDSRYVVFITPPKIMGFDIGGVLGEIAGTISSLYDVATLSLMAEAVNLPGKQLMTVPFIMYGTETKMPYGILYDPLTIRFICSNKMQEKKYFDWWHRLITDPTNNYWNYYDDYVTDIYVAKLPPGMPTADNLIEMAAGAVFGGAGSSGAAGTEAQAPIYIVRVEEAYPVSVASQEMSYSGTNYLTLTVNFAYRRWRSSNDVAAGGSSDVPGTADDNFLGGNSPKVPESK